MRYKYFINLIALCLLTHFLTAKNQNSTLSPSSIFQNNSVISFNSLASSSLKDHYKIDTIKTIIPNDIFDYLKIKHQLVENPEESPYKNLYLETKDIFDQLCKAAGIDDAAFGILEQDEINAFAIPYYNTVCISTGLFKNIKPGELTKDAIAFILAHEIRHLVQRKILGDKKRSKELQFAKEIDADLFALQLMNKAGFNVTESTLFFEVLDKFDSTSKLNKELSSKLITVLSEVADEHLPAEKRVIILRENLLSGNWLNTSFESKTRFTPSIFAELEQKSILREITEKLYDIKNFTELNNLIQQLQSIPGDNSVIKRSLLTQGIMLLANVFIEKHSITLIDNILTANKFQNSEKKYIAILFLLNPTFFEEFLIKKMSLFNRQQIEEIKKLQTNKELSDLLQDFRREMNKLIISDVDKPLEKILLEYSLFNTIALKIVERHEVISKDSLFFPKTDKQDNLKKLSKNSLKLKIIQLQSQNIYNLLPLDIINDLKQLKEFLIIANPFIPKDFKEIIPFHDIINNSKEQFQIYFDIKIEIMVKVGKSWSWTEWEPVIECLNDVKNSFFFDPFIKSSFNFEDCVKAILSNGDLTDDEKFQILKKYDFILFESRSEYSSPCFNNVVDFLSSYAIKTDLKKQEIFNLINILCDKSSVTHKDFITKIGPSILNKFIEGEKNILDNISPNDLNIIYQSWKKSQNSEGSIEVLTYLMKYYLKNVNRDFINDSISDLLLEEIKNIKDKSLIFSGVDNLLKNANISATSNELNITTVNLIYFFSLGGLESRNNLYDTVFNLPETDQEVLALFLNSDVLKNIHENLNIDRNDMNRNIITNANSLQKIYNEINFNDADDIQKIRSWSEYINFLNLKIFMRKLNILPSEIDSFIESIQNEFKVFLIKDKLQSSPTKSFDFKFDLIDMYTKGTKAKESVTQKYERLFKKMFEMPFYTDRMILKTNTQSFFQEFFSFIENNKNLSNSEDMLLMINNIIKYLPPCIIRNCLLMYSFSIYIKNQNLDFDTFDINSLKIKINDGSQESIEIKNALEQILPHLTPDARQVFANQMLFAFFHQKMRGLKKTGLGSTDAKFGSNIFKINKLKDNITLSFNISSGNPAIYLLKSLLSRIKSLKEFTLTLRKNFKTFGLLLNVSLKLINYKSKEQLQEGITSSSIKKPFISILKKSENRKYLFNIFKNDIIPFFLQKNLKIKLRPLLIILIQANRILDANKKSPEEFLKRVETILNRRNVAESLLTIENIDLIKDIVMNDFLERILEAVYNNDDFNWIRKILSTYLKEQRISKGIEKIDLFYFDYNHPQRLLQMDSVIAGLFNEDIKNEIKGSNDFTTKLKYITDRYLNAQPPRDEFLELLLENYINDPNALPEEIIKNIRLTVPLFSNLYFKNKYLLTALDYDKKIKEKSKNAIISLQDELRLISEYFPDKTYFRDDLLKSLINKCKTLEEYSLLMPYLYGDKRNILEDDKAIKSIYVEEKFKIIFENLSVNEKKEMALWLSGAFDKPLFLQEYEELMAVSFNSLKNIYSMEQKTSYVYAGESTRKFIMDELFLGTEGILNNEKIYMDFMEQLFNFIASRSSFDKKISKDLVKNIFMSIAKNAHKTKRLEIIHALSVNFSSMVSESSYVSRSSAEMISKIMESLGIIGIKVAQILISSDDIELTDDLKEALSKLSSNANPLTKQVVFETIMNMGIKGISQVSSLLGSASIKVVFKAIAENLFLDGLYMGENINIALKIKRPDVAQNLAYDNEFLKRVCIDLRENYKIKIPEGFEERASQGITEDADFENEIRNTNILKKQVKAINLLHKNRYEKIMGRKISFAIPEIYDGSNENVILSELVEGVDLDKKDKLMTEMNLSEKEFDKLKEIIFDFLMTQIFEDKTGMWLADPHPGNFRISKGKNGEIKVYLIDVGALDKIPPKSNRDDYLKKFITSLVYMEYGLKINGEFSWMAMFFQKTKYLADKSLRNKIISSKMTFFEEMKRELIFPVFFAIFREKIIEPIFSRLKIFISFFKSPRKNDFIIISQKISKTSIINTQVTSKTNGESFINAYKYKTEIINLFSKEWNIFLETCLKNINNENLTVREKSQIERHIKNLNNEFMTTLKKLEFPWVDPNKLSQHLNTIRLMIKSQDKKMPSTTLEVFLKTQIQSLQDRFKDELKSQGENPTLSKNTPKTIIKTAA